MRIAVSFDAENINCTTAKAALVRLRQRGQTDIRRAVGDFSMASLQHWIDCAREEAIELVMQPSLGKGKNAADIRLTIEASTSYEMDGRTQSRWFRRIAISRRWRFTCAAAALQCWGFRCGRRAQLSVLPAPALSG